MKRMSVAGLIGLMLMILVGCANQKQQWHTWRGPADTGASVDMAWSTDGLEELWRSNVGKGHSAVVVSGHNCYTQGNVMTVEEGDTVETEYVFCLDNRSGETVWRQGHRATSGRWPGPGATPTIDGEHLYTLSRNGRVSCFKAASGEIAWERDLVADSLAPSNLYACAPVIVENTLLLNINKGGMGLDKRSGEVLWQSEKGRSQYNTPALTMVKGRVAAILGMGRQVAALDVHTGEHLWEINRSCPIAPPMCLGDKLFISSGPLAAYQFNDDGAEELWSTRKHRGGFTPFVVVDTLAYGFLTVSSESQPLACVSLETGEIHWEQELGPYGALGASDGKLVITTGDGQLVVAEATHEGYKELYRRESAVTMHDNTGKERVFANYCWTNPTMAGGKIYLKNNYGDITCYSAD